MGYIIDFGEDKTGIYGVRFTNSYIGTRLLDARGRVFTPSSTTQAGRDDFINIKDSPFAIKECVTKYNSSTGKQEVISYEGDSNWSSALSDNSHNVMIEFPKFYYRRPSKWEWYVSSYQHDGFLPSPMHYRNGTMYNHVYVAKYGCNSNFTSQTGKTVDNETSYQKYGTRNIGYYRNGFRSQGMYMWDYPLIMSLAMLMMVKYGSTDGQMTVGYGYSSSSNTGPLWTTGASDQIKGKDGYAGSSISDNGAVKTFGIENYYGNYDKFIDGIVRYGSNRLYFNLDIESVTSLSHSGSGFVQFTSTIASGDINAYPTDITYDSNYPWVVCATSVGPNTSDRNTHNNGKINDVYRSNSDNNKDQFMVFGGHYTSGQYSGFFRQDTYGDEGRFTLSDPSLGACSFFFK